LRFSRQWLWRMPSSLKMEAIPSSETSVDTRSAWRHVPEEGILQQTITVINAIHTPSNCTSFPVIHSYVRPLEGNWNHDLLNVHTTNSKCSGTTATFIIKLDGCTKHCCYLEEPYEWIFWIAGHGNSDSHNCHVYCCHLLLLLVVTTYSVC
jgi:hypothetical protein